MNAFKKISSFALTFAVILPVAVFAQSTTDCTGGAIFNATTGVRCNATATISTPVVTYNGACASSAVIAQENSIQSLHDAFEATMKAAASTRRDALGAAFLKADATERGTAIKAARDAFQATQQTADKTMRTAEKALMDSFKTTMHGCGADMMMQKDQNDGQDQNGDQMENDVQNQNMDGQEHPSMMGQKNAKGFNQGKQDKKEQGKKLGKQGFMMGGDKRTGDQPPLKQEEHPQATQHLPQQQ